MSMFDDIKVRRLDLATDDNSEPHRPDVSVSADDSYDDEGPRVTVSLSALWGQQMRFVELTLDEARLLAAHLTAVAKDIDDYTENQNEAAYMRHQELLMEGGGGPSLIEQQIEAMKLK